MKTKSTPTVTEVLKKYKPKKNNRFFKKNFIVNPNRYHIEFYYKKKIYYWVILFFSVIIWAFVGLAVSKKATEIAQVYTSLEQSIGGEKILPPSGEIFDHDNNVIDIQDPLAVVVNEGSVVYRTEPANKPLSEPVLICLITVFGTMLNTIIAALINAFFQFRKRKRE